MKELILTAHCKQNEKGNRWKLEAKYFANKRPPRHLNYLALILLPKTENERYKGRFPR